LPSGYVVDAKIDWRKHMIPINILGFLLMVPFFQIFALGFHCLRPDIQSLNFQAGGARLLLALLIFLGLIFITIVLHEAIHGMLIWAVGKAKPIFGIRILYAYAASPPHIYFSKRAMCLIALAPLLVISGFGAVLFVIAPQGWLLVILMLTILNASGAVGDIVFSIWLLLKPKGVLVGDQGDSFVTFVKSTEAS